jgi:hypothetical protein
MTAINVEIAKLRLILLRILFASPRPILRIRILETPKGKIDGVDVTGFHKGLVYDLASPVASLLICEGWAEPAERINDRENPGPHHQP